MTPGRRVALALALAIGLSPIAPAAGAQPSTYAQVLHTYEAHGSVPPCTFSARQLVSALKGVDVYGQQYFADFTNAIQSALSQRAGGACAPGAGSVAAAPPVSGAAARALELHLRPVTAATAAAPPLPLVLLGAAALAIGLVLAAGAIRRAATRPGPRSSPSTGARGAWGHLWGEAGWRAGGTWADFRDWLSPGVSRREPPPRG